MFSVKYKSIAVKCPHCNIPLKYKEGYIPGGFNDNGGWLLQCNECDKEFAIPVANPSDFSYIVSGSTIIDNWDNVVQSKEEFLKEHNLQDFNLNGIEYSEEVLDPITFDINTKPIFVSLEGENLEILAYNALNQVLKTKNTSGLNEIQSHYNAYFNVYVKGRSGEPKYTYVFLDFMDAKGVKHTAFFYFNFSGIGKMPNSINEYLLAEVTNRISHTNVVNGIYTRNDCKEYLEKFLIRWKGLHSNIIIAVPFIGYQNQKLEKREALWDWLKRFLDDDNVIFYTRQIAITLLNESRKKNGIPVDILKEFNITEKGIESAVKHNYFHAKFYAGLNETEIEILKGSYNLHENNYLENFDYQELQTNMFIDRYLTPLGIDSAKLNFNNFDAFWIDLRNDKSNIEYSNPNGKSLFYKLL